MQVNNRRRNDLKILFITGGSPWPAQLGVNQRTNLLLRALRQCGEVETVIYSRYATVGDGDREYLRDRYGVAAHFVQRTPGERWPWRLAESVSPRFASRLGIHVGGMGLWYRPQADIASWLAERVGQEHYDLIVGRYLRVLAGSGALAYRPVMLDLDDYDCSAYRSRLQQPGLSALSRFSAWRQARQVERVVPALLGRCDHIWVASGADRDLLPSYPTSVLPNIPFVADDGEPPPPCAPRPESRTILMVGSLCHTVNVDAVERFLRAVWPRIRAAVADSEFRIVGYGMTDDQKRRWRAVEGVVPVGFVEDLREEYERCAFTVVPIFEGGGTKIKVLESLQYGRTLVGTAHSCRGYEDTLRHLESIWIAPDEESVVEGCLRLLNDPDLRVAMAEAGHDVVERHYSCDAFQRAVREAIECVTASSRGVQSRRGSQEAVKS